MNFGIEEILDLANEGHKIKVCELLFPKSEVKGRNHPEGKSVIYMKNCTDDLDYKTTILHEMFHQYYPSATEGETEFYTGYIAKNFPETADFAIKLFGLPKYETS